MTSTKKSMLALCLTATTLLGTTAAAATTVIPAPDPNSSYQTVATWNYSSYYPYYNNYYNDYYYGYYNSYYNGYYNYYYPYYYTGISYHSDDYYTYYDSNYNRRYYTGSYYGNYSEAYTGLTYYNSTATFTTTQPTTTVDDSVAVPQSVSFIFDGTVVPINAYQIAGQVFYELRDVALILASTDYSFNVAWDENTQSACILPNADYEPIAGDSIVIDTENATATVAPVVYYSGGQAVNVTGYQVNDRTYVHLSSLYASLGLSYNLAGNITQAHSVTVFDY